MENGKLAVNDETGKVIEFKDGQWVDVPTARNDAGDTMIMRGNAWEPFSPGKPKPQNPAEPTYIFPPDPLGGAGGSPVNTTPEGGPAVPGPDRGFSIPSPRGGDPLLDQQMVTDGAIDTTKAAVAGISGVNNTVYQGGDDNIADFLGGLTGLDAFKNYGANQDAYRQEQSAAFSGGQAVGTGIEMLALSRIPGLGILPGTAEREASKEGVRQLSNKALKVARDKDFWTGVFGGGALGTAMARNYGFMDTDNPEETINPFTIFSDEPRPFESREEAANVYGIIGAAASGTIPILAKTAIDTAVASGPMAKRVGDFMRKMTPAEVESAFSIFSNEGRRTVDEVKLDRANPGARQLDAELGAEGMSPRLARFMRRGLQAAGVDDEGIRALFDGVTKSLNADVGATARRTAAERLIDTAEELELDGARNFILMLAHDLNKMSLERAGANNIIGRAVREGQSSQADYARGAAERDFGDGTTRPEQLKGIAKEQARIGEEEYEPIIRGFAANNQDRQFAREFLAEEPLARAALRRRAQNEGLTVEQYVERHPVAAMHWTRSEIGRAASSATGSERRNLLGSLDIADDWLNRQDPRYIQTRDRYADTFTAEEALSMGDRFLRIANEPAELENFRAQYDALPEPVQDLAMLSIRDAIIRDVNMSQGRRTGAIGSGQVSRPAAMQALRDTFGERGSRFVDDLDQLYRERDFYESLGFRSDTEFNLRGGGEVQNATSHPVARATSSATGNMGADVIATAVTGIPMPLTISRQGMALINRFARNKPETIREAAELLMRRQSGAMEPPEAPGGPPRTPPTGSNTPPPQVPPPAQMGPSEVFVPIRGQQQSLALEAPQEELPLFAPPQSAQGELDFTGGPPVRNIADPQAADANMVPMRLGDDIDEEFPVGADFGAEDELDIPASYPGNRPQRPTTLTARVKQLGGMRNRTAAGAPLWTDESRQGAIPGVINNQSGKSPDDIVSQLIEDGYEVRDVDDLFQLLAEERAGNRSYPVGANEAYRADVDAYNEWAAQSGRAPIQAGVPAGALGPVSEAGAGGVLGGAAGAFVPAESPEDRARNIAVGAGIGMLGGAADGQRRQGVLDDVVTAGPRGPYKKNKITRNDLILKFAKDTHDEDGNPIPPERMFDYIAEQLDMTDYDQKRVLSAQMSQLRAKGHDLPRAPQGGKGKGPVQNSAYARFEEYYDPDTNDFTIPTERFVTLIQSDAGDAMRRRTGNDYELDAKTVEVYKTRWRQATGRPIRRPPREEVVSILKERWNDFPEDMPNPARFAEITQELQARGFEAYGDTGYRRIIAEMLAAEPDAINWQPANKGSRQGQRALRHKQVMRIWEERNLEQASPAERRRIIAEETGLAEGGIQPLLAEVRRSQGADSLPGYAGRGRPRSETEGGFIGESRMREPRLDDITIPEQYRDQYVELFRYRFSQGESPEQIADRLGFPQSEIDAALNLTGDPTGPLSVLALTGAGLSGLGVAASNEEVQDYVKSIIPGGNPVIEGVEAGPPETREQTLGITPEMRESALAIPGGVPVPTRREASMANDFGPVNDKLAEVYRRYNKGEIGYQEALQEMDAFMVQNGFDPADNPMKTRMRLADPRAISPLPGEPRP